ncbi:MAG: hypothetical protein KC589_03785 [Nanoarchaeota archaeon]|nr:hypothetical protein [Nanoarchaeota archaeon]
MIQLKPTNLIAVEVPEDAINSRFYIEGTLFVDTPDKRAIIVDNFSGSSYSILGEITKEGIQFDVEPYIGIHIVNKTKYYYNYLPFEGMDFRDIIDNSFKTSQKSFQSLLEANNIEIPEGKKLLILLKY